MVSEQRGKAESQAELSEGRGSRQRNGKQKDPQARACLQLFKNIRWPKQSHSEGREMGMRCKRDGEGSGFRIIQNLTVQGL